MAVSHKSFLQQALRIKAVHALDAWLWRRGFHMPQIRGMVLGQVMLTACSFVLGLILFMWVLWPLWFAVGSSIFLFVFWGIARHLSGVLLSAYSMGLLLGLFVRTTVRMFVVGVVLYVTLVVCSASASAIVCGVTANMAVALGIFAYFTFSGLNGRN